MSTAGTPTAFLWLAVCGLLCASGWANEARGQDTTSSAIQDTTVADTTSSEAAVAADSTAARAPVDTVAAAGPAVPSSPVLDTLSNEVFQRTLRAYLAVRDIRPAFRARYGSTGARAEDDTTYRAFVRTAEQAIRSTGLAVETYRALLAAAQTDTLLRGTLRRGLTRGIDSAFVPLDSLRPDSSWIRGDSAASEHPVSPDEGSPDTAPTDTTGATGAPSDTSVAPTAPADTLRPAP